MYPFLDFIGFFGPILLYLLTIFVLFQKKVYFIFYFIGSVISVLVNFLAKEIIRDPRPSKDHEMYSLHGERMKIDRYGMPSGHSQSVGFSLSYVYLVLQNHPSTILLVYFFVSICTLFQRYKYKNHTIPQIIVGFILGIGMGILFFYIANRYILGKLTNKKDDLFFY